MGKYLISTNVDGHLYCNYSTEKLLTKKEAIEKLYEIREIDPDAVLVKVVKEYERRNHFGDI